MEPTIIHFVRHGIVHNPKKIFYGRLPKHGLSDEGIQVANRLMPFFSRKPIDRIFSSPLLRTRQTARILARGLGNIPLSISRYLIEVNSPYDGRPMAELEAKHWDVYSGVLPPFDQPADVFRRAKHFVDQILAAYSGKQIIAVTHADTILFLSLWAKGYEISVASKMLVEHKQIEITFPNPASVTTLTWDNGIDYPQFEYYPNL